MTVYILYDNSNSNVYGVYAKKEDAMDQAIFGAYELQLIEAEVQ